MEFAFEKNYSFHALKHFLLLFCHFRGIIRDYVLSIVTAFGTRIVYTMKMAGRMDDIMISLKF